MNESEQRGLGEFAVPEEGRPDEEAAVVAGDAGQAVSEVVDAADLKFPDAEGTLEMTVSQVDYTVEGSGAAEYPVVHVFGRTAGNDYEHVRVLGMEPYFYVPTEDIEERALTEEYDAILDTRTEDLHGESFNSIRGKPLTKVVGRTPRDVGQIRDDFDEHYEADILFPNRFLIDKDVSSGLQVPVRRLADGRMQVRYDDSELVGTEAPAEADLRVNTFDIEVDDRQGFPEDGEEPIVCLTSHDSYRDEYIVWLYNAPDAVVEPPDSLPGYEAIADSGTSEVRSFDGEPAMLDAFIEYVEETNPDVLTGWNCLPADSEILLADGSIKPIEAVEVGDRVVGSNEQSTTSAEVTNKWESEKEILQFNLADGTDLRTSREHRVMVGDDESVEWREGGDIEPGEFVLKPRKLNVEEPNVPRLDELVPAENQRYNDRAAVKQLKNELPYGAVSELSERFGISKEVLYHPDPSVWTPERCRVAVDEYDVPVPDGGTVYRRTRGSLERELSRDELYLAGLVLTDGSMSVDDGVRFYNTREELHEQFPGDSTLTPDGKGCDKQNVLDYATMYAFNGLGIPFGDKNAGDIDLSTVFELPENYIARFLAGAIDGDGSVGSTVTLAAENPTLGDWYVKLFKRLGVYAERNDNVVRVPDAERDIRILRERVEPHMSHTEKAGKLSELSGGKSGRTESIPYALFEAQTGSEAKRIGRDKRRRDIDLKRHETTVEEWEDYVFVRVDGVESAGTETAYDIETGAGNFIAEGSLVHNCDDFDMPYVLDRLERIDSGSEYDLDIDRFSRIDEVWRSDWGGPDVKGRVVFDLLYGYKQIVIKELESFRLDAIGERELDVGKEHYSGDIGDLWEQDPEQLLEYNLRDVELCVEIDRKQDVVSFWNQVRSLVGCKLEDAPTAGDAVDMYVLHKAYGEFALPSKGQQEAAEEFEGGAVFEPITGVKENVTVLDLKCFSGDTDVLTPEGPRNIKSLNIDDEIYTLNPDTFECELKPVVETHAYENSFGELHHLSGNTHDFKITENHRFLASKERSWDEQEPDDFEFAEYREFTETERYAFPNHKPMDGRTPSTFDLIDEVEGGHVVAYSDDDLRVFRNAMPEGAQSELELAHGSSEAMGLQQKVGKYLIPLECYREHRTVIDEYADDLFLKFDRSHRETPLSFEMADWLELLGWYVTEGSIDRATGRFTLHQADDEGRKRIRSLLDRMGVNYNADERGVNVSNTYLLEWLRENCGDGYANKRLPDWVFELDGELLRRLLDTLVAGDGSVTGSGLQKFWTKSDDLKAAVVDIAVRCGEKPSVSRQSDGTWYVSIGKRGSFQKSTNGTVEPHDGKVYCVTAEDNHVVLAGRNGHYQWVGQSLYPMSMATINSSPETKVDPEEYDGETYQSPDGTHFRKEPDGIMREMIDELLTEREEKKALRDQHEPGSLEYEQYDQQQGSVKVVMNCFTPDTDVLTPEGVRNIRDLGTGDKVYSLDPETEQMEVKPVTETHAYPEYDGELIDIQTSKIDFRVTPNHRMLVRKNETNGITEDGYSFVEAGDLDDAANYELPHDWSTDHGDELGTVDLVDYVEGEYEVWVGPEVHGHTFAAELGYYPEKVKKNDVGQEGYVLGAEEFAEHREYIESVCEQSFIHRESGRKWIPRTFDGDDFLDLLSWYITEGNVYTSEEKQFGEKLRGSATTVQIAQQKPTVADGGAAAAEPTQSESDHAAIGDLLDRMGFDCYVDDRSYQFTSRLLGETLERLCGADSFEKRIPEFVFDLSERQKRRFLETLVAGDGDRQPNSWRYTTSSDHLRDDVLRLCTHLGLTANYGKNSGSWRIYVAEDAKNTLRMQRGSSRSTAEDGVYCVTVADNHSLLAGRNGTFQFVGQSLYGVSGWDRFRLYDTEGAAAVTATGREVIEFTETAAEEIGHEVAYGDSVTGDRPVVTRNPDREVRILSIETLFERASPIENGTVRITAGGGPVADATPGKTRAELPGWEALSVNDSGEAEWRPITQAIRHEVDKPVVNLQHKFGESTTTRDHSYVVEDGNELAEAAPGDVDEPLRVPGVPSLKERETLDVYDVLDGYSRTYEDGRAVGAENAIEKTKRVHTDGEYVWFGQQHHGEIESTPKVKRHIDLNTETGQALIRLLAAYVTEGSASTAETTESKFGASIAESRTEWLEGLKSDYERLFENVTAGIINSDVSEERTVEYETGSGGSSVTYSDETQKLQVMNELSAVFFREFVGQQSHGKRIPSFIFHLPEEQQRLFLETLVEGDGSREFPRYSQEYAERNFDYETVSRELAAGLSMLLTQRGKKHSLKYRESKSSYTIRTCDYYRGGQDPVVTEVDHDGYVYDLSVEENENFVDGIGGLVLHNTDSVMLSLGQDISKDEAIEESFSIQDHINQRYDDFAGDELNADSHRFEIEFEKLYRRFFQAGKKKRYAGHIVWKEGKDVDDIDITGFEYKRSDIAATTKRVQKEVIDMIVRGEDLDDVKEYLHEVISEFQEGNVDLEKVGIPGGIGKRLDAYDTDTAQVRGAKYANLLLGTNFQRGSKPKRLYLKKVHPEFWQDIESGEDALDPQIDPLYAEFKRDPDVICFEYAEEVPDSFEVDWDKMLDKTLKGPIERVIEALGLSWDEVKSGQEQTGLGQWG